MKPKVSVIIPVLNEQESIAAVLGDIPPELEAEVLVVDNGCTNGTIPLARSLGAWIVLAQPRGYGAVCYAGTLRGTILAGYFILTTTFRYAWR